MRRDITPEDLALHALRLLDAEDAFAVEQFAATSPEARQELALLHGDLATYALAAETHEPPALAKQQLLKNVMRERRPVAQRAPVPMPVQEQEPVVEETPALERPIAARNQAVPTFGQTDNEPQLLRSFGYASASAEEEETKPKRTGWVWAFAGLGWAAAVTAGVLFVLQTRETEKLRTAVANQSIMLNVANKSAERARMVWDTITSPSSQHFVLTRADVKLPSTAHVAYLPNHGALVFQASNMAPLPPSKTYELWLIPADANAAPMPAGTFKPDANGNAEMMLPPDIPKGIMASKFGITMEDDGGASVPSKPILMIGQ